jgi:adenosylmethionine-8-amino-7-oxononanoate aminotransferase
MSDDLLARDSRVLWHPLTQHALEPEPLPVVGAQGTRLLLADGREILDGISSWWCNVHGHGRQELVDAMTQQASKLDHVLLAGTTHEPAVRLAERLIEIAPKGLARVFYSDDGSTAVEVALKMARQFFVHRGELERTVFIAFDGGYHGDTFGAMAVSDPDPYFLPFQPLCFEVARIALSEHALASTLDRLGRRCAGVILEPRVQGAAGMKIHSPEFLRAVRALTKQAGVPFIADEVMTGFGRTGSLFACHSASISPDLLCLSKGLTGGILPLSATLATEEIYQAFLAQDRKRAFFHGHTFTGNPIACAVALASLDLVLSERVLERFEALGKRIESRVSDLTGQSAVLDIRRIGGIVAIETRPESGVGSYFDDRALRRRRRAIELGVLLRPLGNVLYAMPPACCTEAEADRIADVLRELVET